MKKFGRQKKYSIVDERCWKRRDRGGLHLGSNAARVGSAEGRGVSSRVAGSSSYRFAVNYRSFDGRSTSRARGQSEEDCDERELVPTVVTIRASRAAGSSVSETRTIMDLFFPWFFAAQLFSSDLLLRLLR